MIKQWKKVAKRRASKGRKGGKLHAEPTIWLERQNRISIASAWLMLIGSEFYEMVPTGVTTDTTRVILSDNPECFSVKDVANSGKDTVRATKL